MEGILELLVNYDTGAIIAVLAFTGLVKKYIKERFVPLIPFVIGGIAGVLKFFTGADLGEMSWYNAISGMLMDMLVYAGIGSILFKFYKTTLMKDKSIVPVIKETAKKIVGIIN